MQLPKRLLTNNKIHCHEQKTSNDPAPDDERSVSMELQLHR